MSLSLEDLRALAAVNPFRWEQLTREQILVRCHAAGLNLPNYFNPVPATAGHPGMGKTVLTRAVLEHIEGLDSNLAALLRTIMDKGGERYAEGERLVFEVIETMAAYAARTALERVADAARNEAAEEASARRAM